MSSDPIRLQYLFHRYMNNNCTPDELNEFWALMRELSENDTVTEDIKRVWEAKNKSRYTSESVDWDSLFDEMMRKGKRIETNYEKVGSRRKMKWMRIAAAACLLGVLVVGGVYFLNSRKPSEKTLQAGIMNDIIPGRNGAILTLDNGRQVLLDSSGNGVIALQHGARIELDSGKLIYQKDRTTEIAATNTMATPVGRKYQLTLSDGTKVWLNAASSITFPTVFSGDKRVVSITGEAYFEVARNVDKPFYVNANSMMIEVLGTNFDVNAYSDEAFIKTTLLTGSVRVKKGNEQQLLLPGQQAQLDKEDKLRILTNVDMDLEMAWKNDEFYFKYADLKTVMRQLSRWYDLEIVYAEGAPLNKHFEGEIPMNTMISQVLSVLEKNDVRFNLQGKKLTVLP